MPLDNPYYSFVAFFQSREQAEVEALLEAIDTNPGLMDIHQLAQGNPHILASTIEGEGVIIPIWAAMGVEATMLSTNWSPVDPDAPTLAEQRIMDGLLDQFYSLWPGSRRAVLEAAIRYVGEAKENTTNPWKILDKFGSTSTDGIGDDFFRLLADYYIAMAKEYIRATGIKYRFIGHIPEQPPAHGPVRVSVRDNNAGLEPLSLGHTTTTKAGYFSLHFSVIGGIQDDTYPLEFTFEHPQLAAPVTLEGIYNPDAPQEPVMFEPTFGEPPTTSALITDVIKTEIPSAVTDYLTSHGITATHLKHIRQLGGFRNLPGEGIDPEDPDLMRLDAMAALEVIDDDLSVSKQLYNRGYHSVGHIALAPQSRFVQVNTDLFEDGDLGAARLHYRARAAHMYGVNNAAAVLAPVPDHDLGKARTTPATATGCNCSDCLSAVSPIAYLADLTGFAISHLTNNEETIDIEYLEDTFLHRLAGLKQECGQLSRTVCQNRIAAESLRRFLDPNGDNAPTGERLADLETAEKAYLKQAYELLLNALGASHAAIRNMRGHATDDAARSLAHQMGIPLKYEGDATIPQLYIDLSDPDNITEPLLESVFGLRNSNRDPLEDPDESLVEKWKKARLAEIWEQQDGFSEVFPGGAGAWNAVIDPDVVTIDDLRHPVSGLGNGLSMAFDLWKKRRDWIDAEFAAMDAAILKDDEDDAVAAPMQSVFRDLRMVVARGGEHLIDLEVDPVITYISDPTTVLYTVVDQFVANGDTYYRVAETPDDDAYGGTITLPDSTEITNTRNVRSCPAMIARFIAESPDGPTPYGTTAIDPEWPADPIEAIRDLLLAGGDTLDEELATLALDRASAERLLDLYDKNLDDPGAAEPEGGLTEAEWAEFKNILIMVLKRRACDDAWKVEETPELLGPRLFFRSINAPGSSGSPFLGKDPLIDPDLIGTKDLPEVTAAHHHPIGEDLVYDLLADRRTQLLADRDALLEATSMQELLDLAFASPGLLWTPDAPTTNDYLRLLGWLTDDREAGWTRLFLSLRLGITEAEFRSIVEFGVKFDNEDDLTAGERERMLAVLQRTHKHLTHYKGDWAEQEQDVPHWKLRKAHLPAWRATPQQRTAWLNALARNSEAPIIDPDLVCPSDLRHPVTGDRAHDLWYARAVEQALWMIDLTGGHGELADIDDFNALVKSILQFVEPTIESLREASKAGVDIRPRLAQLDLTPVEFDQLLTFHDLLAAEETLNEDEKTIVRRILRRVRKLREAARYRFEECATPGQPVITLSPRWFKVREPGVVSYPPDPVHPIQPWLASEADLTAWRRKLAGRVSEEKEVADAWHEALFEVDEAMMVHLRDALVRAAGDPALSLIGNARDLGDRFLTDLENNCCYKTNRVAAAIESLQQLLWKTRTGDILTHHPDLAFNGDFDQAWEWMGSYANWRAAMFVFLYPENVLHPSLKSASTQAFKDIVEGTRNNRRFGPDDACRMAHDYEEYLKDLADLEVACSQQARTWMGTDECGTPQYSPRTLTYVFARAARSKRLYYTVVDTNNVDAVRQTTCWNSIPTGEGVDYIIHGSHRYSNDELGIDHILLFVTDARSSEKNKFHVLKYALVTQQWDSEEPQAFEVSTDDLGDHSGTDPGFDKFDPTIRALCVMKNMELWRPPLIAITLHDGNGVSWTFRRELNGTIDDYGGGGMGKKWVTNSAVILGGSLRREIIDCWHHRLESDWAYEDEVHFFLLREPAPDGESFRLFIVRFRDYIMPKYSALNWHRDADTGSRLLVNWSPDGEQTALIGLGYQEGLKAVNYTDVAFEHPGGYVAHVGTEVLGSANARFVAVNPDEHFAADLQVSILQEPGSDSASPRIELVNTVLSGSDPGRLNWDRPLLQLQPKRLRDIRVGKAGTPSEQAVRRDRDVELWAANQEANDKLAVPVAEASYFVPMQIALQLQANGHYQAALDWFRSVYDHMLPPSERKISHFLRQEEDLELDATRMVDWYADPLDPHGIAGVRPHTYTRYTIRAIVSCLLDYADAEFTMDTSETVPRARELYEDALDLLKYLNADRECAIDAALELMTYHMLPKEWVPVFTEALERLEPLAGKPGFQDVLDDISEAMLTPGTWGACLGEVEGIIDTALAGRVIPTFADVVNSTADHLNHQVTLSSIGVNVDTALTTLSAGAGRAYDRTMEQVTGLTVDDLASEEIPWLSNDRATSPFDHGQPREYVLPTLVEAGRRYSTEHPAASFRLNDPLSAIHIPGTALAFCVVPNPVVNALVLKAEVELFKIHNCMNIAGMVRELDPFAAPTDSTTGIQVIGAAGGSIAVPAQRPGVPSAYRYKFLVERARQLVGMAQQVEAAFLSALEKLDAERYTELRAEQDVATSRANIKLQDLKIKEAEDGVQLATLQKERATAQEEGLKSMISAQLIESEKAMIELYEELAKLTISSAWSGFGVQAADFAQQTATAGLGAGFAAIAGALGIANALAQTMIQSRIANVNMWIQQTSLMASYERRKQEWEFQLTLAVKDKAIGDQQIKLANDRVRIVGQEREIAVLQSDHAKATLDFLRNKFTSTELYEWMSGVLEDVYAWFLQEATAVALLAERQLIFERNLDFPSLIRSDYWQVDPNQLGSGPGSDGSTDRRGITGSTRLLRDLTQLDQAAFSTNSPRRQLSKTFALSELAPEELIRLRAEGLAGFYTTHDHFDRDYPGHYLRLIRKVSVTVIALAPPTKGIKATLTNGGISRVFTGGVLFQERTIERYPEEIALSSGVGDSGVFPMQPESEFLNPFEGSGVDTLWEFRMDKAANPFDYASIADVLITIDYEALSDRNRRSALAAKLNTEQAEGALAISFKNNLPDQWFDLHNPAQDEDPYRVTFNLSERDLAAHVKEARISGISLFVVMKQEGAEFLGGLEVGLGDRAAEPMVPEKNFISSGRFASTGLYNEPVAGVWSFAADLGSTPARVHFDNDEVDDIYLIIRYTGSGAKYTLP